MEDRPLGKSDVIHHKDLIISPKLPSCALILSLESQQILLK